MFKKYLPYGLLILVALLLFIKRFQRITAPVKPATEQTDKIGTDTPVLPAEENTGEIEGFNRNAVNLVFSKHARCRMDCRHIDESEVREILAKGKINREKIQRDKRGITYPVEGTTHDGQFVRIVFAPKENALVVVTVIDLGKEWSCDCK